MSGIYKMFGWISSKVGTVPTPLSMVRYRNICINRSLWNSIDQISCQLPSSNYGLDNYGNFSEKLLINFQTNVLWRCLGEYPTQILATWYPFLLIKQGRKYQSKAPNPIPESALSFLTSPESLSRSSWAASPSVNTLTMLWVLPLSNSHIVLKCSSNFSWHLNTMQLLRYATSHAENLWWVRFIRLSLWDALSLWNACH